MLQIDDTIISLELLEERFVCDLNSCKGICCIEGDDGAPLEEAEVKIIEDLLPVIWDDLSEASKSVINKQGVSYIDQDGEPVTSIVNGAECVFTYTDESGVCKCAIEKAFREGKTNFYKPISCHLYPVRLQKYDEFTAVNYHRWSVCGYARKLGGKLGVPVYQFLKEPLIRRFGTEWFEQLEIADKEFKKNK
ncbi:hypothetical protein Palpr_1177 [Paludibacter propionicigenes WB4]|uniref:DUF3109 family protein n=1 Tax=Paludibacter propionicigenes (strain DSM 17365 / JCM 13257 / WB4) TaxID=694427 RepID=E4T3N0_PALPW|nr:DUF3109 family protein [Paludibacter propionicigenes]ADQ79324.1 hypothetical protein Palpr_1177 [Paludibacter propionicigenes WB4]